MRLSDAQLRELQHQHGPAIFAYLVRRIEPRADADAAFNDVLEVAWRRAGSAPTDPERVRVWLFAIATRVAANHRRASGRRRRLADRVASDAKVTRTSSDADPDLAETVRAAIAGLSPRQRELVRLVHWEDFTLADAAAVLGISASTARSHYQTARERLARELRVE